MMLKIDLNDFEPAPVKTLYLQTKRGTVTVKSWRENGGAREYPSVTQSSIARIEQLARALDSYEGCFYAGNKRIGEYIYIQPLPAAN